MANILVASKIIVFFPPLHVATIHFTVIGSGPYTSALIPSMTNEGHYCVATVWASFVDIIVNSCWTGETSVKENMILHTTSILDFYF